MKHDDHPSESDALGRRLHREAMTERPRFSEQLHQRILDRVEADRLTITPSTRFLSKTSVRLAIAAALLGALTLIGTWTFRDPPKPHVVELNKPQVNLADALKPLVINIDGVVTARTSPPEIVFHTASRPPEPVPAAIAAPPGSPEWLLAALNTPTTSARDVVEEVVPAEVRMLVGLVRWER